MPAKPVKKNKDDNTFDSKRFLGTKDDTNKGKVNKNAKDALARLRGNSQKLKETNKKK